MYITRTGTAIAEDATQIFGGRAVTQSGMGRVIENVRLRLPFFGDFLLVLVSTHLRIRHDTRRN